MERSTTLQTTTQLTAAEPSSFAFQPVIIERPLAHEVRVVDVFQAQQILFRFPLDACRIAVLDIDVILTFPDEARIILPAFALQLVTADPPHLSFANVVVEAQSFIAGIGTTTLSDQFPKIAVSESLVTAKGNESDTPPPPAADLPATQTAGLTPTPQSRKYETSTGDLITPDTGRYAKHTNQDVSQGNSGSSSSGGGASSNTPTQPPVVTKDPLDQAPHIISNGGGTSAAVRLTENHTSVAHVQATDSDSGDIVHYVISGGADAQRFSINSLSGNVSFVQAPDFEHPGSAAGSNLYDVVVSAVDQRGGSTDQRLTVEVDNLNEAPTILSNGGAAIALIDVLAHTSGVTTVLGMDPDAGTTLHYAIVGGADASKFVIDAGTGALAFAAPPVFSAPVDVGGDNVYNVVVEASDGALSATQALAVAVKNDDAAPQIISNGGGASAAITLTENLSVVTTVVGSDPDVGNVLHYSIAAGADASKFVIDPDTGLLSFLMPPNFESPSDFGHNNVYDVVVQVSDGFLFASQTLAITVTDINEAPAITSNGGGPNATVNVVEHTSGVTTVIGSDPDIGNTLTYAILGGADAAKFTIDSVTGALTFASAPDFQSHGSAAGTNLYDVVVQASDGTFSTSQHIAVNVTQNISSLVITSNGGGSVALVGVSENNTAVTTVTASDPDPFAILTYSIAGGSDAARFVINPVTGVLSFAPAPNFELPTDSGGRNVYDVIVQASDGSQIATQEIAVLVTNINEAPVITSNGGGASAGVNVLENGTAVTTVVGFDPDAGTTLAYSIVGGADAAKFSVDALTGALRFTSAPNFEAPTDAGGNNVYDVVVALTDGTFTASQAIAVTVTNVNETPSIISNGGGNLALVNVLENATGVTTVVGSDPDASTVLHYAIVGGADSAKFTIDANTGALSFITAPDFETPGDSGGHNVYDVIVETSDGSLVASQELAVIVGNVNEAPIITSNGGGASATVNVTENTTAVTTVVGVDPDSGNVLHYSIVGGADAAKFTINFNTGALAFLSAPNFETPTDVGGDNVYDVIVRTTDGTLGATQAIAVIVTNNNEPPIITSNGGGPTASISILENTSAVTTVIGADPDAATTLTYSISGGADASKFTINAATGALSFISAPDFEAPTDIGANNVYDVIVQTSDGSLTASQSIAVTVTNVNEAPVITSNGGGASASISIGENATAVTTVIGADPDAATTLTYSIAGGADASKFTINAATGALSFISAPNFEAPTDIGANNIYDVIVQATDGTFNVNQAIAVTVANVNETPIITSNGGGPTAAVSINENSTAVTTVVGADPDAATTLTYAIIGGADAAKFAINAATGVLSFISAPNFEVPTDAGVNNVYDVIVRTSDGSLTANQSIAVTVNNVNEVPVITSNGGGATAAKSILENTTAVTTVTATDPDASTTLVYSISGGADAAKFTINSSTGVLTFITAPNFEVPTDVGANNVYDVTVKVTDGTLNDTQAIAVTVTNVNEVPVITSNGGGATASVTISENATAVTTVIGADPDAATTLTYSIAGGADASKFTINAATGALSFISAPNFETPTDVGGNNVYDVIVQTSDGSLTASQSIAVTVTNVNEAPVITSNGGGASASISMGENAAAVTLVVGADPDAATTLHYGIVGGSDASKFAIDFNTGVLTFVSAPNFEAPTDVGGNNVYDVIVQTTDGSLTASQSIAVTVTNVNEAPVITSNGGGASASVTIGENATAVTTVIGADPDAATTLTYSISGGADASQFTINAATGALSFISAPNFEAPTDAGGNNVYDVIVQTTDGTLTANQSIAVTVTDINEAPVITSNGGGASASVTIGENATAVTTVIGADPDAATTLTYSIAGGADASKFTINAATGALSFISAPNFEAPTDVGGNNVYDVIVQTTDGSLTASQSIAVTVTNVNEAPVITSNGGGASASVTIGENATAVTTVIGADPDAATTLTYSISGGADASKFTINAATGALSFISAPNFEAPTDVGGNNVYDVIVQTTDGSLTANQSIAVTVTDLNEAPVITSNGGGASASISIGENAAAVTTVIGADPRCRDDADLLDLGRCRRIEVHDQCRDRCAELYLRPELRDTDRCRGQQCLRRHRADNSDGSLTASQSIAVTVTDLNEAPVITSNGGGASASVTIGENATAVTTVIGADPDAATTLTYSISGGADASKFTINAATGALSFISAPNFEAPTDAGGNNVYDVIVQTTDGSLTASQSIAVTVTNVNEAPVITSNGGGASASVTIGENATAVTTVIGADPDAATTLTYSISGGADASKFTINAATGALSFISAPNFEAPTDAGGNNVYDVIVQTTDGTLTANQSIAVTVTDINEAPVITSNGGGASASVTIGENTGAVTTVIGADPDAATTLTYSISGGADASKFTINAATGALSFISAPNFEAPTDAGGNNVYDVVVQTTDGSLTASQSIAVTVTNVNEAPVITSNGGGASASVTIGENATAVTTVIGADPDAATTLTYSISGGADASKFTINAATGALSFISAPNFEAPTDAGGNNVYDVIVQTTDGTLTANQSIAVTVTDINEAPVITSNGGGASASVTIGENATAVTTVIGADPDAATTLTYSISGGADASQFTINAATGALSFISAPNFEAPTDAGGNNVYDVIVQTTDGTLTANQSIAVTVTDINEAPVITSNGGGASASVTIGENATAVTTVIGADPDAATTLTYSISGGADASKFTINAATGALSFISAPNFEAPTDAGGNNVYDVVVQTTDGSLTANQSIAVTVTDINEAPVITSNGGGASASVTIGENATAVTTVIGADPDAATTLTYSISGGADASQFTINAATGALSFISAPNFEAPTDVGGNNVYDVIVQTTDGSLTASQSIAVTVTNVNEAPVITSNGGGASASVTIGENATAVTTVIGADPDAATTLTYSISGGADASKFTINAATGALSFISAPNFEAPTDVGGNNVYDVIVQTTDGSLTANQSIAVTVTNVNEAPVITSNGGGASASVTIGENATAVTTVIGADPDAATTLTYSISGGADASQFTINAATGALSFISAPNFEAPTDAGGNNVYDVIVQTTDGTLTANQSIAVTVTDINEAPVITSNGGGASASVTIGENTGAVTTVSGLDPDAATTLTYSISGGADASQFTINAATGALSFISAPNFEAPTDAGGNNVYDVIVQTSDGSLTASQSIAVTVTDINEAPVITSNGGGASASVTIGENTGAVTTVSGLDPDAATTLTYSISGGADASKFTINAATGALSFISAPNFEAPTDAGGNNVYDVVVQTSDGSLTASQSIAVTVTDINEAPSIVSDGGHASASIYMADGVSAVTTVAGSDPDAATTLHYAIAGGADASSFTIDGNTGVLSFVSTPFGTHAYDVTVQASDGFLAATQNLHIVTSDSHTADFSAIGYDPAHNFSLNLGLQDTPQDTDAGGYITLHGIDNVIASNTFNVLTDNSGADNVITGGANGNLFLSYGGADQLIGDPSSPNTFVVDNPKATILGGAGDDFLNLTPSSLSGATFQADLGGGTNEIFLGGSTPGNVTLAQLRAVLTNVETIDLGNPNVTADLTNFTAGDATAILGLSGAGRTLTVDTGANTTFSVAATEHTTQVGGLYTFYTDNTHVTELAKVQLV